MAPLNVDATIIVMDIGRNVSESEDKNDKSFFKSARECVIRIIERKIMSRPKDLIGIILLGSKKTNNVLAEQCDGAFRHIEVLCELTAPNWQVLRDLPEKALKKEGDWFEALIVAAERLKNSTFGKVNKKVILMTNFQHPAVIGDNSEQVLNGFVEDKIEVDIIGPEIFDDVYKGDDIDLARKFVEVTDGVNVTFENAMRYLLFHRKKAVTPMLWNVGLSIGESISIPVSVYGRIRDETVIKKWQKAVKNPVTNTASTVEGVYRNTKFISTENQTEVEAENIIPAYMYGGFAVPISSTNESMLYNSGDKCLSIYGFTNTDNIKWHNLTGNGVSYLFGRKGNKKAQATIDTLIHCLKDLNMVGIVRRVYNKGNAPVMHVLFPVIDNNDFICLSLVALCFKEDIKSMAFPPTNLKKYNSSEEQINAFKDLIKAMDLMNANDENYDDKEAFPVAETVNPSIQYILDCIAFRAMNPGKPLPQPRDDIIMLFKVPSLVEKRAREPVDRLKKLFVLKEIEIKAKKGKQKVNNTNNSTSFNNDIVTEDVPKMNLQLLQKLHLSEEVTSIGTIDPISDMKALLNKGKTLADLKLEIVEVIENLIYINFDDDYTKALETMRFFRTESVNNEPSHYNDWLVTFKSNLMERQKNNVLHMIIEEKLNLITKDENSSSSFTLEDTNKEDSQLYENDTIPNSTELLISSELNDLYDEM
ncbi:X-ray repair cross-complementing protein 5 [Eumeta japonica]|uniref:X-ray repair cross-complementing protein 5 n=1 Tax=Eumeta variegata TaxID=151549 RepID=A0A4C1TBE3_EUMVA|nr:X-ray repair cross-complementing protein 5 [Eumeta japonica]